MLAELYRRTGNTAKAGHMDALRLTFGATAEGGVGPIGFPGEWPPGTQS